MSATGNGNGSGAAAGPLKEFVDPDCVDPALAAISLRGAPWRRMVVLGDSVAAGVREPVPGYRDLSFAERLAAALAATREGFEDLSQARRNALLAEVREEQLEEAIEFEPDVALVVAGGNDVLRGGYEPERIRFELAEILDRLALAGALPVTVGLFDLARSGLIPGEIAWAMARRFDRLDEITAQTVATAGGVHVDTHHHPRAADPCLFAADRIHANARGHAIAFAAIVQRLAEVATMEVAS